MLVSWWDGHPTCRPCSARYKCLMLPVQSHSGKVEKLNKATSSSLDHSDYTLNNTYLDTVLDRDIVGLVLPKQQCKHREKK